MRRCARGRAGCGDEQSRGGRVPGDTLTVFSSLPLQGPQRRPGAEHRQRREAGAAGCGRQGRGLQGQLRLRGRRHRRTATASAGIPDQDRRERAQGGREPAHDRLRRRASTRARPRSRCRSRTRPASSRSARGRPRSGSRSSCPERRRASPTSTIPSGTRKFARVVPADDVQASAAAGWTAQPRRPQRLRARRQDASRATGSSSSIRVARRRTALRVVGADRMDPRADDYRDLAARDRARRARTRSTSAAVRSSNAVQLWRDLHEALPEALADRVSTTCSCRRSTSGSERAERQHLPHLGRAGPEPAAARGQAVRARLPARVRRGARTRSPRTATRRCRCCWTRSSAPATAAAERERVIDELFETDGLRQRGRARSRSTTTATRR